MLIHPAVRRSGLPLAGLLLLGGCGGAQSAFLPFGVEAAATLRLTWIMAAAAGLIALAVAGLVIHAVRAPEGRLDHAGGMRVILWLGAIGPTLLLLGLLVWALPMMRPLPVAPSDMTIAVSGEQFWWRVTYRPPGGAPLEDANLIRIPVGRTVRLLLDSPDVIHSFWVPGLAGKMDMIPGRVNELVVRATRAGRFRGQCAEFCGPSHARMAFDVIALPPADFDRWIATGSPPTTPVSRGRSAGAALFAAYGCGGCHVAGAGGIGPNLTRLPDRLSLAAGTLPLTRAAVARFTRDAPGVKPGALMPRFATMSVADADAIAAYLLEKP